MANKIDEFIASIEKVASEKDESLEKKAAEAEFEKFANQNEQIEAATTLNLASGMLEKFAGLDGLNPEMKELFTECSSTLADCSADMMLGLQKVASDDMAGMVVDAINTQQSLYKVATVLKAVADGCEDADFVKMASAVADVNNRLYDEIAALAETDKSVDAYLKQNFGAKE